MGLLIDDSSIISVNASVISSNRIISAKDVQRTGWVSLSVRGIEQPYPSATFSGPAEILTKGHRITNGSDHAAHCRDGRAAEPQSDEALAEVDRVTLAIVVDRVAALTHTGAPAT